uniref:Subtilisin-like protease n=1 Tax=Aegilops tauschii subsp. strangulata TaxID=200361 RepID=A0A453GAD5_AEGTS
SAPAAAPPPRRRGGRLRRGHGRGEDVHRAGGRRREAVGFPDPRALVRVGGAGGVRGRRGVAGGRPADPHLLRRPPRVLGADVAVGRGGAGRRPRGGGRAAGARPPPRHHALATVPRDALLPALGHPRRLRLRLRPRHRRHRHRHLARAPQLPRPRPRPRPAQVARGVRVRARLPARLLQSEARRGALLLRGLRGHLRPDERDRRGQVAARQRRPRHPHGVHRRGPLRVPGVCWVGGCFDSDILAAFDAAVADGVDVVSLSVGGAVVPYYLDAIAIGAFGATEAGIVVSASAGNGGPGGLSVTNVAPWMTTVGAGSMDRAFPANVRLGNGQVLDGVSVYGGPVLQSGKMYELVYAGATSYSASTCLDGSLDQAAVRGKIVVCDRGVNSRAAKGDVVHRAGAAGMVLANGAFDGEGLVADCHVLPATAVGAAAGEKLRKYIASSTPQKPATGTILFQGTHLGVHPAPVVAAFSARGPNPQSPETLKPDLIAPGLNILAAWPSGVGPAGIPSDGRRTEFNILSGTSMACPHVSGLAALLKAAHPTWSPAAIKSALMTTAYTRDNSNGTMTDESTGKVADVFDFGAGHVDPMRAMDPGLVYDIAPLDYLNFLCNLNYTEQNIRAITRRQADCRGARRAGHAGNLNYPSLSATFVADGAKARMRTHFIRTVTNVGGGRSAYRATVRAPEGCNVTVRPDRLAFRRDGQKLSFTVHVEAAARAKMEPGSSLVRSGALTWSDGRHAVVSPIVVTLQAPVQ